MPVAHELPFETPVREVGYVRFKVSLAQQLNVTAAAEQFSTGFTDSGTIEPGDVARLLAQPDSRGFASVLFDIASPRRTFRVNDWTTLNVVMDVDFCFFNVTTQIPNTLFGAMRIGSQTVTASTTGTLSFGPSRAAWIAMGTRLGPAFSAFVGRVIPALAAPGAAASTLASLLGTMQFAVPIGIAVRDLVVAVCAAARQRGVRRGQFNVLGMAYVRAVYGMRQHRDAHTLDGRTGIALAEADLRRSGAAGLQRWLEQRFRGGRAVRPAHGQGGPFNFDDINDVGGRFGEALFAMGERDGVAPPGSRT